MGSCSSLRLDVSAAPIVLEFWKIPGQLLPFSLQSNTEEVGSDTSKADASAAGQVALPVRERTSRPQQHVLLMSFSCPLWGLTVGPPTSHGLIKKPSQVCPAAGVLVELPTKVSITAISYHNWHFCTIHLAFLTPPHHPTRSSVLYPHLFMWKIETQKD